MGRKKPKKAKSNRVLTIVVCVLAVVCLLTGGIYIDTFYGSGRIMEQVTQISKVEKKPKETEKNQTVESMAVDVSSKAMMAVFGQEFLLCTKDGVKYFASMGDQKWNDTFNMTSPMLQQEGDYVAVGDLGGKTIRVYNREGMLYDLQTEGSPMQFALNENGYLSIITKGTDMYRIRIYNGKGTLLKERIEESSGVYPLSSDISDDSRIFAVSYLDTTDIMPIARVVSFYIDAAESEEHTDSMFAAVEKQGEIIPVISYRKGGMLAALSDMNIYGIGMDGQEAWSYPLENTIDMAALGAKDSIVIALGDSIADKDGREKGTICWLDASGKETASYESGESVTYLYANDKGVVFGNERRYTGLSSSGNENWNYTATSDMTELLPMEKLNRVMTVGKDAISILVMTKEETPVQPVQTEEPEADAETGEPEQQEPAGEEAGETQPEQTQPSLEEPKAGEETAPAAETE